MYLTSGKFTPMLRAEGAITTLTYPMNYQKSRKNVNKPKVKLNSLKKKVLDIKKQKSTQANEIDLLKEHNAANILKLESCAKELKEKKRNKNS